MPDCLSSPRRIAQANIQKNSTPEDWRAREAATFAFGSMLEGPSPETLGSLVSAGLPFLLAALKDAHPQVKNTTAWTIGECRGPWAASCLSTARDSPSP